MSVTLRLPGLLARALRWPLLLAAALLPLLVLSPGGAKAAPPPLVLGTTVALQQTGLLAALLPAFEQAHRRPVTVVAVSVPHALALGARGELDLLLVDAGDDGQCFVEAGHGLDRRLVLHDDMVLVGPRGDTAGVRAARSEVDALQRIAAAGADWVSRADKSGPYQLERRLWHEAGVEPAGQGWYVALGQGMRATLLAASERQAYTLADRASYLALRDQLDLAILAERFPAFLNLYHAIPANPARGAWIDAEGARALADFLLSPSVQAEIARFGVDQYGQPIFTTDAGRADGDVLAAPADSILPDG